MGGPRLPATQLQTPRGQANKPTGRAPMHGAAATAVVWVCGWDVRVRHKGDQGRRVPQATARARCPAGVAAWLMQGHDTAGALSHRRGGRGGCWAQVGGLGRGGGRWCDAQTAEAAYIEWRWPGGEGKGEGRWSCCCCLGALDLRRALGVDSGCMRLQTCGASVGRGASKQIQCAARPPALTVRLENLCFALTR